jgi:DNA-binding response OmpR family regulator
MTKHILIVEDDYAIQEMLQARLAMEGYSLSLARDGQEAMERLETIIPSIILLDLGLPHMNGYALLEALEKQRSDLSLPVIIMTADPQAPARLAQKPVTIFPKPFALHALVAAIKKAISVKEEDELNHHTILSKGV